MLKDWAVVIFLVLLALANGAYANEFTGAIDDRFCEAGNWDPPAVPGPGDDAVIGCNVDVVIDCDVTVGALKGPGWECDDPASLTINAGSTAYFEEQPRDEEGECPWVINVFGSMTVNQSFRVADEAYVTYNISGAGASLILNGGGRAGDNDDTGLNINMDSGVFVLGDTLELGDDGGGIWNLSGTASVSFLKGLKPHLRMVRPT
jgi:hypothetical protein